MSEPPPTSSPDGSRRPRRARSLLAALAVTTFLASLCLVASTAGRARAYRMLLHGPDGVRAWAIDRLVAMGPAGVPGLFEAVESEPPPTPSVITFDAEPTVAELLVGNADPAALDAYIAAIGTLDPDGFDVAVRCLSALLDEEGRLRADERVRLLRELVLDGRRRRCFGLGLDSPIDVVGMNVRPSEVEPLLPAFLDGWQAAEAGETREELLGIVAKAVESAVRRLAEAEEGFSVETGERAAAASLRARLVERLPELVGLFGGEDELLADQAERLLVALVPESDDAVVAALDDPRPRVRVRAAIRLAEVRDDRWVARPFDRFEADVVERACAALGRDVTDPALVEHWLRLAAVRVLAEILALRTPPGDVVAVVFERAALLLGDEDPSKREAALLALGHAVTLSRADPPVEVVDAILPALEDEDARVRVGAVGVLAFAGTGVEDHLRGLLDEDDQDVARAALVALVRGGASVGVEALPIVRRAFAHPDWTVREEISRVAIGLAPDVVATDVVPLLVARLGDDHTSAEGFRSGSSSGSLLKQIGVPAIAALRVAVAESDGVERERLVDILDRIEDEAPPASSAPEARR